MTEVITTRREALKGCALAGAAALAAGAGLSAAPARAAAALQGPARPVIYRFGFGAFEVTTILDGAIQLEGPYPIFGEDQFEEDVKAFAEQNFLPPGMMEIAFTVTLVNTGEKLVMFDSGNGAGRRPNAGHLRNLVTEAGLSPDAVDIVAMTHFHPDHIGGLAEEGAAAFPDAEYCFPSTEYDFWSPPEVAEAEATARVGKLVQSNVVPQAEKARMIGGGDAVVSGIEAMDAFGHTPGHTVYHVESEGKRLLLGGDFCNHYVMSLAQPEWHVRFDMDKDGAVATRKALLSMLAAERIPFVGYHMPFPAVGYVEEADGAYRYVPASYQMNL